jgi:hypothetical protein
VSDRVVVGTLLIYYVYNMSRRSYYRKKHLLSCSLYETTPDLWFAGNTAIGCFVTNGLESRINQIKIFCNMWNLKYNPKKKEFVLTSPWRLRFIVRTCRRVHVYILESLILCAYVDIYVITSTMCRLSNIKIIYIFFLRRKKECCFEWSMTIRDNYKVISRFLSYYKEINKQMAIEHNYFI